MTLFRPLSLTPAPVLVGAVAAAAAIGLLTTPYMGCASLAYFLMILGLMCRRRDRLAHRRLMFSAMGIDLTLVLLLELQRNAVETVASLTLAPLPFGHVLTSTAALLLYLPLILLGKKLWAHENPTVRRWHKRLGFTAFALRTLGFILMFSLLGGDSIP